MVQFKRFNPNDSIKPFDCGDSDLNGFLLEEDPSISNARHHANELLAVTYVIEDETECQTIAYFSLLNDKIEREITDNTAWNRLSRKIPNNKRRKSQPAVKIGRLAVSSPYQGKGWGEKIISLLKQWFTKENKTGCRFITVDALVDKVGFYEKYGFDILVTPKENEETVLMYYDLKRFISTDNK
ncbi:MAG: GNAT family N-acetyltransferase [Alistipes sp.]|nr:GNAT family N-acetyltransferase [Alistipes sp.]